MTWDVKIRRIDHIKPIDGADSIEVAFVGNYPCVVKRGDFVVGDLAAYIPVDSLVPDTLLAEMGLTGKLGGSRRNRVKAIKLRGQLSIGLLYKMEGFTAHTDVSSELGIEKYEEVIPPQFAGVMKTHPRGFIKYDIDNIRGEPSLFQIGEPVVITEKLHGTQFKASLIGGVFDVHSRNTTLQYTESNLYWRVAKQFNIEEKLKMLTHLFVEDKEYWIYAEIFGPVQDLTYGLKEPTLRVFDIRIHPAGGVNPYFENWDATLDYCKTMGLETVPELYRGPFSQEIVDKLSSGQEKISGFGYHITEGCVIKPLVERLTDRGDRAIQKSINPDYLLRKGNTTEYH